MADLAIVPTGVVFVEGPTEKGCVAGAAFGAGDIVALDSDGTWKGGIGNSTVDRAGATKYGMALFTASAAGARGEVALPDAYVTVGAFVTAGVPYFMSPTGAGKLAPFADITAAGAGTKVTGAALGVSSTRVKVIRMYDAGSVKP